MYRSIVLELTPSHEVQLHTVVIEDWLTAQAHHDAMRDVVQGRNGQVIYASLLNLENLGGGSGCCSGKEKTYS